MVTGKDDLFTEWLPSRRDINESTPIGMAIIKS